MNYDPRIHFDENAAGTGGAPPAPDSGSSPSSSAPAEQTPSPGGSDNSPPAGFAAEDPFAGMDDDFDSIDLGAATEPNPGSPGTTPPVVPPPTPAPGALPAAVAEVVPPAAVVPPVGNEPSPSRSPLDETIDGFKANKEALVPWAAQNLFKLSDKDTEALEANAAEFIPQLMGRLYVDTLAAAGNLIRNFVPQMIAQQVEQSSGAKARAAEAANEFYTSNPHLNAKDHDEVVNKWAKAYRAANPKASRKEAIAYVGRAVSFELGINPGSPPAAKAPPASPFAPARPGGRPPTTTQVLDDPYAGLDQDFDQ